MERLVGINVTDARFDGENIYLGSFKLTPWGDCCARCYIQHVSGTNAFPGVIQKVENVASSPEMQAQDGEDGRWGDVSESWAYRITTDKGICSIEMRLEHNGYYGGSLDLSVVSHVPDCKALDDF